MLNADAASEQSGLASKGALVKWPWATIVSYKALSVLTRQAAETALMIFTTSMGFVKCSATICHQKNYRQKREFSGCLQKIKGKFDSEANDMSNNVLIINGTIVSSEEIIVNGVKLPPCPSGGYSCTVVNNRVYIDGFEFVNGKWKKTFRALWHKWF